MEKNTLLLGKLLGEIYRMQARTGVPCSADVAQIFGLVNGFEDSINRELESIGFVSSEDVDKVIDIINPIWEDPEKLEHFNGYYAIEPHLTRAGISRSTAIQIFNHFAAAHQFTELLNKMNTSNSPSECRQFGANEWEK